MELDQKLTGIHKLTYKLSPDIEAEGAFYKALIENSIE